MATTTPREHKLIQNGIEIADWVIHTSKNPILRSTEKETWEQELQLNELPEMVYGNNFVRLSNEKRDITIVFNCMDALKLLDKTADQSIKVSSAKKWEEINKNFEGQIEKSFDWTFSSPYTGSILSRGHCYNSFEKPSGLIENTTEKIDIEKLKRPDPILFFDDVLLYEDELADNGESMLSVKIRVMHESVFLLARFFLRVDDVIVRCLDTRIYHEFNKDYLLKEVTFKETNFDVIKPYFEKDPTLLTDSNFIVSKLPTRSIVTEKILLTFNDQK
ncbi:hypothetical protein DICPUDRAFT_86195 [Dictyostelium purpureum]|uniref:TIP41-like protein n=1 Tax=Dictyostelium purpureum TaxID=5786 RepID=F0ZA56_DICPU|nr:uncharacterized protein DICPUDRAFT_86195 [Dictyostelium purpureum]EGC39178.1 hypothetical protein DICPUDRAFT_86195 [Dictyostelium purpureum]|eukprot:XP_003284324.1 hypothetical protein DICPUDRAFT_86195 [Dictyostelium purpureum]